MLTIPDDIFIVLLCAALTFGFLWGLRRFWPSSQRREHNEIIGWQVSVLGTTYAVIMGFMLYAVWTDFTAADQNANTEASSLVNVFRIAEGLPPAQRDQIQNLAREYADSMLDDEWPAMHEGGLSSSGPRLVEQMWTAAIQTQPTSVSEQTSLDHLLSELGNMTQCRRLRELQSKARLPGVLWIVLIAGGVITTLSSCLFGTENFKLHAIQVLFLSFLLSLALVAIGDIDRPFRGTVHVVPAGFARARDTFAAHKSGIR